MLLPDKSLVVSLLRCYRAWEVVVLAEPHDLASRRHLEDVAYTLCVLMGQRTTRDAITEAEFYLGWARSVMPAVDVMSRDGGNQSRESSGPRRAASSHDPGAPDSDSSCSEPKARQGVFHGAGRIHDDDRAGRSA
ncbi:DUF5133 domain-containing protein [Streptomyces sp. NPDC048473]|uniref:DUF5133 domain-containing protein n=1 Tax=unclassified Streptomyces TaxID=2593676 RepID=UPI003718FBA7